uniref:Uncharacterized protein n=1 Tax=Rhodnius prolixus TaxID=13249 RepID=T1I4G6_RHOPR
MNDRHSLRRTVVKEAMENWQKISLILCAYGILKEFRPSEPFVTKYLNNPPMNFTDEQVLEVFYGLFTACEVAYYTYIYAKVDKEHYQEVSSHTRASYLIGRALSGILSQILVSTGFSYLSLNYFTLG